MRIPFGDLEEASRDPGAYLRKRSIKTPGFFGISKYHTLQLSVYRYHKLNQDLNEAQRYLEEGFLKHFKQRNDLPKYIEQLEKYANGFIRLCATSFRIKDRLSVPLNEELSKQFKVSGEIPRVDLTSEGYTAWLFAKKTENWKDELRLPLIQFAYAEALSIPVEEMKVGVYDFSKDLYTAYEYSEKEIRRAKLSLTQMLASISPPSQK